MNYLRGVFSSGSVGPDGSRAFGLWSKYFAGISDSRGSGISGGEGGRTIITTVFRPSFRCFFPRSITRSLLAISA
jgi:hypothetical protein